MEVNTYKLDVINAKVYFEMRMEKKTISIYPKELLAAVLRYSSISSATFSLKSDMLDSLSELSFSVCSRKASSVAKRFT